MNDEPGPAPDPRVRVTLPDQWDARCRSFAIDARARRFREQLGLPTDRPIVMTGHQASLWHAGILTKYIAADEIAERFNAAQARLVVDQDDNDPFAIRVPVLYERGVTTAAEVRLGPPPTTGMTTGSTPPSRPGAVPDLRWALPSVRDGVTRSHEALMRHADAPSAASQIAGALDHLMSPYAGAGTRLMATAIARTDLFAEAVDRMRADPGTMARAYNDSATAIAEAGIKPLTITGGRVELPMWTVTPGAARTPVWSNAIPPTDQLAPKALLMTGLLRLAGCDLFIHGTGGLVYDQITERWFGDWLGQTEGALAPMIGVTANLLLPLPFADFTASSAARAKWLAHSAPHNPALTDDNTRAARKREILTKLNGAPRDSAQRILLYLALHALLDDYRAAHASSLEALDAAAARADDLIGAGELARDRTWPFPLHADKSLRELSDRVRDALR